MGSIWSKFNCSSPPLPNPNLNPSFADEAKPELQSDTVESLSSDSVISSVPTSINSSVASLQPDSTSLKILHISFNQDFCCFAIGTNCGFRIYNCDPFQEFFRRDIGCRGGIGFVEMLFRSNMLALVGGGTDPQYAPTKAMIWDDHLNRCIGELSFRSEVRSVKLTREKIIVVMEQKIYVYNFSGLEPLDQIETTVNSKGLCALSYISGPLVLVCPGLQMGEVRVVHYGSKGTKFIKVHDSSLSCFALTLDGNLLATSSTKGTSVRIHYTTTGSLMKEVSRGADSAEICSLAFSSNAEWLAVSSVKGTVHVFSTKVHSPFWKLTALSADIDSSPERMLSELSQPSPGGALPVYSSSEWSVPRSPLAESCQYFVAFSDVIHTVVIVGMDGSYYKCRFNHVKGGEMKQLEFHNFIESELAF